MVWYGMVWYGTVRYGTVRYGMVWYVWHERINVWGNYRRHLNPTPVAPTYDALPADVDIPIERDEGEDAPMVVVDAPMAVVVPPEPRRNPVRARNQPAYLRDYV